MEKAKYVHLIFFTLFLLITSSCKKEETINSTPAPSLDEISELVSFHGNKESKIVVVNTQGGPLTELDDEGVDRILNESQTQSSTLFVNVHQEQTKNPAPFRATEITIEQAKEYNDQSVNYLKRVLDFFKMQEDKKVYVLGLSFGALMAQELIATHGVDIADGFLLGVGRLDMDKEMLQSASQGKWAEFIYDDNGDYTIEVFWEGDDIETKNSAILAAGLGYNRYTKKLDPINDLSKITYVYGNRDDAIGSLSEQEIQFLKKKMHMWFLLRVKIIREER